MRITVTTLLDVLGLILLLTGAFLIDWRAGLMSLGAALLLFSYGLARAEDRIGDRL